MDSQVGGKFRWAWNGPDGRLALTIYGENREVSPPSKVVHTERMEMGAGAGECGSASSEPQELLVTLELTEREDHMHLRMTVLCPSKEVRDAVLASGMEQGVAAGYDKLDELLPTLGR